MSKTLADILAARESIYVNCAHPMCGQSTKLDVQALIERLGPDHAAMHDDLVRLFGCAKCKAAGRRNGRIIFLKLESMPRGEFQRRRNHFVPPAVTSSKDTLDMVDAVGKPPESAGGVAVRCRQRTDTAYPTPPTTLGCLSTSIRAEWFP